MTTWVFGYGSLMFRAGFDVAERRGARLQGFRRVFYQGSPDHRGTPNAPGRVVTLLSAAGTSVAGVALRVPDESWSEVLARLDVREAAGYERAVMPVKTATGPLDAWVFYATENNANYLGPASPEDIAAHVAGSRGPSGANAEYVLRLAAALRDQGADDPHVFAVEGALRARG